jgi:hypothetical protein
VRSKPSRVAPRSASGPHGTQPNRTRNQSILTIGEPTPWDVEELLKSVLDQAKKGDPLALPLAMAHTCQRPQEPAVELDLPPLRHAKDSAAAHKTVAQAMADGELTPAEALHLLASLQRIGGAIKALDPDGWHFPIPAYRIQQSINPSVKWLIKMLS